MRALERFVLRALSAGLLLALPAAAQEPIHGDGETPAIMLGSNGGSFAVWVGRTPSGRGIFLRREGPGPGYGGLDVRIDLRGTSEVSGPSLVEFAGGLAAAWSAPDGDGLGFFVRRFDMAQTPEALASAPRRGDQTGRLHPLPDGGFAAVWTTPGPGGKGVRLAMRRYPASADAPPGPVVVLRTFGTAETFHAVTPGPGEALLVSWQAERTAPCAWRAQRFGLGGRPLAPPFDFCTFKDAEGRSSPPVLAAGGGGYVAVWNGPGTGIFGRRFAVTGEPLGPTFRLDQPQMYDEHGTYAPALAAAPSGAFAAAWSTEGDPRPQMRDGEGVQIRFYAPDGTPRSDQIDVPERFCFPGDEAPAVATGPDEQVVVARKSFCRDDEDPGAWREARVWMSSHTVPPPPKPGPGTLAFTRKGRYGVNEEDGFATLVVQRIGGSAGPLRVSYETLRGTADPEADYAPVEGVLTWADGDASSRTLRIPVVADGLLEPGDRFDVVLWHVPERIWAGIASVTIDDPGSPDFAAPEFPWRVEVWEGSRVPFTVERYDGRRGEIRVGYGWTTRLWERPVYGHLLWTDGDESAKTFSLLCPQDVEVDGFWRTRFIYLVSPYHPLPGLRALAIQDDEVSPAPGVFRLEARQRQVDEAAAHAEVRVRRFNGMGGTVSVRWTVVARSAAPGADFRPLSGILTWGDSDVSLQTIRIPLRNDRKAEEDETFDVLLRDPQGGALLDRPARLRLTIRDDD